MSERNSKAARSKAAKTRASRQVARVNAAVTKRAAKKPRRRRPKASQLRRAKKPKTALDFLPDCTDPTGAGARALAIFDSIMIVEGKHAGERFGQHAPEWQRRIVKLAFGHTDSDGKPIYRRILCLVGKGSGKTTFAAAFALTWLLSERCEARDEIVIASQTANTARRLFDAAGAMLQSDEERSGGFRLNQVRGAITSIEDGSTIRLVSPRPGSVTGLAPSLTIVDELHLVGQSRDGGPMLSQLELSQSKRQAPLTLMITTAPQASPAGVYLSTLKHARAVRDGDEDDPAFLPFLCEIPDGLNRGDPKHWHWAMPSLGYTADIEQIEAERRRCTTPSEHRDFESQFLNLESMEAYGDDRWLPVSVWDAAAEPTLSLDQIIDQASDLIVGIDAGGLLDCSALAVLGRLPGDRWGAWARGWINLDSAEERVSNTQAHRDLIELGELIEFTGGSEDLDQMARLVLEIHERRPIRLVACDPYGVKRLISYLESHGLDCVGIPQGWKLTAHLASIERAIRDRELVHTGGHFLRWNVRNAIAGRRGNAITISKAQNRSGGHANTGASIDGLVALINAWAGASDAGFMDGATGTPQIHYLEL